MTERLHFHFSLSHIRERNSNPLQCSCLENPRDRGAWWAAIYGIAQSRTRLKLLSSSIHTHTHTHTHTYTHTHTLCSQFMLSSPIYSKSILLEGLSAPGMITDCCDFLSLIQTCMFLSSGFVFSYSFQWRFFCMLWEQKGILSILLRKWWLYISSLN